MRSVLCACRAVLRQVRVSDVESLLRMTRLQLADAEKYLADGFATEVASRVADLERQLTVSTAALRCEGGLPDWRDIAPLLQAVSTGPD